MLKTLNEYDEVRAPDDLQEPGAVALQGYNVLLRSAKVELDIREQTEFIERLEALDRAGESQKQGGRPWGA